MTVAQFMDVHVHSGVTQGLRARGVDVLTAQEDGSDRLNDPDLMDPATALLRILFSEDEDFLREAARRQGAGEYFSGLIYAHQRAATVGKLIADLELIAKVADPPDMANRVVHLPFN